MLSDVEIRAALQSGEIVLTPPPVDSDIQPASVDVHLGNRFGILVLPEPAVDNGFDVEPQMLRGSSSEIEYVDADSFIIYPNQFILCQLSEKLTLGDRFAARVEGKSSNGRKGLGVQITAGFVDAGWDGYLTLELYNFSDIPYILRAGDAIAQLAFDRLGTPAARPYGHKELGSHYQGAEGTQGSLL